MSFKTYLQAYARPLDLRLYEHLFEEAAAGPVLAELATYQNADGGFGQALEPDLRLPESSALATVTALQYLAKLPSAGDELASKAVKFLLKTYDQSGQRWINIPPAADNYPRAPWWNYKDALESVEWGNPSAEVLGYLLQHVPVVNDAAFLEAISQQAVQHLSAITQPEQHEVKCYIRLYQQASKQLQTQLHDQLATHITQLAKISPSDWQGYVATPLTFIDSPDSPFAELFDPRLLQDNAEFLRAQLVNGDHWEPTWEWGQFDKDWARAKQDWSGKLTVDNLALLQAFGVDVPYR